MWRTKHGTPFSTIYGKPMSMTLTVRRTTPSQRRWGWKSEKPFNPPGTISERCGQLFSICSAWIFISYLLMNRKHSKRFCQNRQLSKTARSTSAARENENSRCGFSTPATAVLSWLFCHRITRLSHAAFKQEHFTLIVNSSFFFKRGIGFYGCKSNFFQVVFHLAKFI